MLENLKQAVYEANMSLWRQGLVVHTWGNASGIDRASGLVVIKPSGVPYDAMKAEDMVVLDLSGKQVEGSLNPSSDTPTHLALYNAFENLGGIVHTHSTHATAWAQTCLDIPCYGTTHADYFRGSIPCCRPLTIEEVDSDYEGNTGTVIVETFRQRELDPAYMPGVLCANHGVFTWGKDPAAAVYHASVLEEVAKMAFLTQLLAPNTPSAPQHLQDKHFLRKHGPNAYYGQK